jgi:hypothetical protein
MYTLAPDEKTSLVMIYTQQAMIRGEAVVKNAITRISTWLRTQGAPEYIHLLNVQILDFSLTPVRSVQYPEFYLPTQQVIAFHLAPPAADAPDYDADELNRIMQPITLQVGVFTFKGLLRLAGNATVGGQLEAAHSPWVSAYDLTITTPGIPSLNLQVNMALLNPARVFYGMP